MQGGIDNLEMVNCCWTKICGKERKLWEKMLLKELLTLLSLMVADLLWWMLLLAVRSAMLVLLLLLAMVGIEADGGNC